MSISSTCHINSRTQGAGFSVVSHPVRQLFFLVSLACVLALGLGSALPVDARADDGLPKTKYHQLSGTVYFSRSHNAKFCESDGNEPGVLMANVPIELDEVCNVDLDDYGLGDFKLAAPDDANYEYECTFLQLFVYAEQLFAADPNMMVTGKPHSSYLKQYWGDDENFLYYVNGGYPLDETLGEDQGATSDALRLKDGDVLTVAHYSDWSFYTDDMAGFHYFVDEYGDLAHTYVVRAGEPINVRLVRAYEGLGSQTNKTPEADWRLWWGAAYDASAENDSATGSIITGEDGTAQLSFDEPGTYFVWADGGKGANTNSVVNSPACARVEVTEEAPAQVGRPCSAQGLVYDGNVQVGVVARTPNGPGTTEALENVVLSGVTSAVDAGNYLAYAVPAEGFTWPDGTAHVVEIPWSIERAPIADAEIQISPSGEGSGSLNVKVLLDSVELDASDYDASLDAEFESDSGSAVVTVVAKGVGNYSGIAKTSTVVTSDAVRLQVEPYRAVFTGNWITPKSTVYIGDQELASTAYELRYINEATGVSSRVAPTAVGSYRVKALLGDDACTQIGYDSASVSGSFEICEPTSPSETDDPVVPSEQDNPSDSGSAAEKSVPKTNSMTVVAKPFKAKAKVLKKKSKTIKVVTVSGAKGKVSFKLGKVTAKKKLLKQAKKKIRLTANGSIKLKKGLKRGVYKVTIRVVDTGDTLYKAASKTVTVKVTVK